MGVRGSFLKKRKFCMQNLTKEAIGSYSVTGDSLQYIYSVPVTKNHRNIRSRCLVHEFPITDIF